MEIIERKIHVSEGTAVSSVWAAPVEYRTNRKNALIIAHGAGNDMNTPFLGHLQSGFAAQGIMTVKFNFPYKEVGRKAPDRAPVLEATWRAVIDAVATDPELSPKRLFLSGKSMGGRIATHLAAEGGDFAGVILFGYPLHAPNKTETLRADHLARIQCPLLFFEGTRDPLCRLELLEPILQGLSAPIRLHIIEGGDHSFKVLKRLGRSETEIWDEIVGAGADWIMETAS